MYAGTSIHGGIGQNPVEKEARLFIWDAEKGEKTYETVPVPGETAIGALIVGPDGNIWGLAQGTLFIFDPDTNEVIYSEEILTGVRITRGGAHLEIGKDGHIYGTVSGKFFKIDSDTKEVTVLREQGSYRLAQDELGNFYFKNGASIAYGNSLWRYTIEDNTVSVTGVVLDKTELALSTGESAQLNATVEPSFATNKDVSWESSNSGVATVDSKGQVKAVAPGTAVITVTTDDGGKTATCTVNVQ